MWACEVDPREAGRCRECTTTRGSPGNRPRPKIKCDVPRAESDICPIFPLATSQWILRPRRQAQALLRCGLLVHRNPGPTTDPQKPAADCPGVAPCRTVDCMTRHPPERTRLVARAGRAHAHSGPAPRTLLGVLALLCCLAPPPGAGQPLPVAQLAAAGHGLAVARTSEATHPLAGSAGATPTRSSWSWPLAGSPSVLRGFEPPAEPWLAGHRGVDLLASPGEPVLAAGAGRVTFAGWVGGVPAVAVTHPDGRRTTYEPVLAVVTRGDELVRGAILGRVSVGGSHCLPRACLHWGLRVGSSYLDPLSLVGADIEVRLLPVWSEGR